MDLEALLRGAGQGASLGWNDEIAARLLAAKGLDDGTGIPREYKGGQYEQYRDSMRADDADAQARSPKQYLAGEFLGAAPGAIATAPVAGGATTASRIAASGLAGGGIGAIQGAGASESTGKGMVRDAAMGAGVGGALGAGIPALGAGFSAAKKMALEGLDLGLAPAAAGAGAGRAVVPAGVEEIQITRMVPPPGDTPPGGMPTKRPERLWGKRLPNEIKIPKAAKAPVAIDLVEAAEKNPNGVNEKALLTAEDMIREGEKRGAGTVRPGKGRPR